MTFQFSCTDPGGVGASDIRSTEVYRGTFVGNAHYPSIEIADFLISGNPPGSDWTRLNVVYSWNGGALQYGGISARNFGLGPPFNVNMCWNAGALTSCTAADGTIPFVANKPSTGADVLRIFGISATSPTGPTTFGLTLGCVRDVVSGVCIDNEITPPVPEPGGVVDVYDGDGSTHLVQFSTAFDSSIRTELNGDGQGSFKINRHSPEATAANLAQGNLCKVTYPRISPDPIFAWFLETGDFDLVSTGEEAGENLSFAGRGARSLLARAVMWDRSYLGLSVFLDAHRFVYTKAGGDLTGRTSELFSADVYTAGAVETLAWPGHEGYESRTYVPLTSGPFSGKYVHTSWLASPYNGEGSWLLFAFGAKPGQILYRIIAEAKAAGRPQDPLAAMAIDFSATVDSNGDAWASSDATALFTAQIGEDLDSVVQRLIDTGDIVVQMGTDLTLHAYNSYGVDRHSATFATDKVRFVRGENIADVLTRSIAPVLPATHLLVDGDDAITARAVLPDAASRLTVEAYASIEGTDASALQDAGEAMLTGALDRIESAIFNISVGEDPLTGQYLPGDADTNGHFWLGDTVTLDTGTSDIDYDGTSVEVMAISIGEDDAANLLVTPELLATQHYVQPGTSQRLSGPLNQFLQDRGILPGRPLSKTTPSELGSSLTSSGTIPGTDVSIVAADVPITDSGSYFTGTDVEAALQELGAGGGGGGSLPWYNVQTDGTCVGDGVTDDTVALQSAMDTATLGWTQSATLYFPPGTYLIGGALQDTGAYNGQLILGPVSSSDEQVTLRFLGASRPPLAVHGPIPTPNGYSILQSSLAGASGTAAVVSGGNGGYPLQNNVQVILEDLICLAPANPTFTWWNLSCAQGGRVSGVYISTTTDWVGTRVQPTHSNAYGIKLPGYGESNYVQVDGLVVSNFYTGYLQGELTVARGLVLNYCIVGVELGYTAGHASMILSMHQTACTYGIRVTSASWCDILQYDAEHWTSPSWADTVYDFDDGSNLYHGNLRWFGVAVGGAPDHVFDLNGGSNGTFSEIGPLTGGVTVQDEGTPLATAGTTLNFVGSGVVASGTGATKTITVGGFAGGLDDLSDVTLTTPASADRLRFDGTVWRNSALIWRPMTTYDPASGLWVPLVDGDGNAIMAEA